MEAYSTGATWFRISFFEYLRHHEYVIIILILVIIIEKILNMLSKVKCVPQ